MPAPACNNTSPNRDRAKNRQRSVGGFGDRRGECVRVKITILIIEPSSKWARNVLEAFKRAKSIIPNIRAFEFEAHSRCGCDTNVAQVELKTVAACRTRGCRIQTY